MNCTICRLTTWLAALALASGLVATASAQVFTGRVDVTVQDATGARLPGATVELSGTESHAVPTDSLGQAHFLNLAPGPYQVKVALSGFSDWTNTNIPVVAGGAVPLTVAMKVAGVQVETNVTAEAPVLDIRKTTISTNVTYEELQNVPS